MDGVGQDLLSAKLYRPSLPGDCVDRSGLVRLLEEGRSRPLTLVSAPAGYGKSVLVSSWIEQGDWTAVWVSLDENDQSLKRFLGYLTAAVCAQFPDALQIARTLPQSAQLPAIETVVNIVSNELNAIERPFLLVLDDYHRIHAGSDVQVLVRGLLDRPPIPLHLVVVTRRDPPLPLGRLRAQGQVTEVRMQDLRFSEAQTRALLEHVGQDGVSDEALANLDRELEGWAAGLRLMTLALRHTPDPDGFMKGFRGGTQQMQDYLVAEVMAVLPKALRDWLGYVAFLDRFSAPLCEAVCMPAVGDQTNGLTGSAFLDQIQSANLFLIPLDGHGHWFRFHHLFQQRLQEESQRRLDGAEIAAFHMRASQWFEERGLIEDAIEAAVKAGDTDAAADILDRHRLDEEEKINFHVIERWLALLDGAAADRPSLQLAQGYVTMYRDDVPSLAAVLKEVSPAIEGHPDYEDLVGELRHLQGVQALRTGDGETGQRLLREVHDNVPASRRRGLAGHAAFHEAISLGICGRGAEALAEMESRIAKEPADPFYYSLLLSGLVYVSYLMGDLARTVSEGARLAKVAEEGGVEFALSLSVHWWACSDFHRGDYEAAGQRLSFMAGRRYTIPRAPAFAALAGRALCRQFLRKDIEAARALADLEVFAHEVNDAMGLEIAQSCRARIQFLQGDLAGASRWAGFDSTPPPLPVLLFSIEVPALTRARIWIAQGTEESLDRAYRMLQGISAQGRDLHLVIVVIETDVLISLALAGLGRRDEALDCLSETVARAAPGGWVRPFQELGRPMADLLGELEARGQATDYSRSLRKKVQAWCAASPGQAGAGAGADGARFDELRARLTDREVGILKLLQHRLQNKEIARELSVSPETVKTHLKHLYAKLDVHSRREAAAIAKALGKAGIEKPRPTARE